MNYILFVLVVMLGVFVQSLVGFGGTLLSMPLGILLLGLPVTKPVMTLVAWLTGASVLLTDFRYINWRQLLKMTGVMLVGVLGGLWVTGAVQLRLLLLIYAVVVAGVGARKLFLPAGKAPALWLQNLALGLAGVMQGLFVSGGSFLAVYSVNQIQQKQEFRATVNAVWGILNVVMLVTYGVEGALTREVLIMSAVSLVPTVVAIWLGRLLAGRVKQEVFLRAVYLILMVSGIVLFLTNL